MTLWILPVCLALAVASTAAAQEENRISADSPDVDGTRIRPGEWIMRYVQVAGDTERQTGEIRFELMATTTGGRPAFRSVQTITTPRGLYSDTVLFVRSTLRPVLHRSHNPQRTLELDFHGTHVAGSFTPAGGETQAIDHTMEVAGFDANILDVIFGALPLEEGYSGTVIAYVYEAGGSIDVPFRVTGSASIVAGAETRDAWELDVTYPFGQGRFWVDRLTRQPLGAEIRTPNGVTTRMIRK